MGSKKLEKTCMRQMADAAHIVAAAPVLGYVARHTSYC